MKRVTLVDVAEHAGVSRATASLVVRDAPGIADATRERVRRAMAELGYVYNRGAAALRSSRTQSIGLIVPDITNGFTAELVVAIEAALGEQGKVTFLANSLEDPARQDLLVGSMLERHVDGLVVMPAVGTDTNLADRLAGLGPPVVVATRSLDAPELSYVGIDNVAAGRLAGEHLAWHGVKHVGYLGGEVSLAPRRDRISGARGALDGSGAVFDVDVPGPFHGSWGREIATELIEQRQMPEALICHNDMVAFGVMSAVRDHAPQLRDRIRVISYDDVAEAALWERPLTTVASSGRDVGLQCAEVLLERVEAPAGEPVTRRVAPHLVVRRSCGCAGK